MRTLRQVLFYLFLLAYLIATPVAILYALGYIWAPGAERGLVRSGLIAIASTPDEAQIHLGNSRYTRRTPTAIRDLLPGIYNLRLTQRNSDAWQGEIEVKAERATVLDHIILLPANRTPQTLAPEVWSHLHSEPGERNIVLESPRSLLDWALLDASEGRLRPLLPTASAWGDSHVLQTWFRKDSPHALFRVQQHDRDRYLWFDFSAKEEEPLDVTRLFLDTPDEVVWDPRIRNEIYTRALSRIHRLSFKDMAIFPDCAPPAKGFALNRNHLYILSFSNSLLRVGSEGATERTDYLLPTALAATLTNDTYAIHLLPDDALLVCNTAGALWLNALSNELAPQGVREIVGDEKEDQWLVVADHALGLLGLNAQEKSEPWSLQWIHSQDQTIQRAAWIHDDTHILFSSQGRLLLLALERGGGGAPRNLGPVGAQGAFYFSERTGYLYALNEEGRLTRLRLLPPRSLIPLPLHAETRE
ncbi:MAG: hypothetical protein H3C50_07840 [Kiritimatiellae bacterium]|nr:hypothetical protein [Kiritimatiellia bacterium]MCO5067174.1 hypothetical protein [Kiritimatiellia bacterium]